MHRAVYNFEYCREQNAHRSRQCEVIEHKGSTNEHVKASSIEKTRRNAIVKTVIKITKATTKLKKIGKIL
jgi:hypothetical protein